MELRDEHGSSEGVVKGRVEQAKADLNASIELLPTTIAYLELGKIAESEGQLELAARYYQAAG